MERSLPATVYNKESSTRSLYHGTLLDHLPSIQQHGLVPEVGPFVSDAYDLDPVETEQEWDEMRDNESMDQYLQRQEGERDPDYISPEEMGVEPVVFMTDKKRLGKALNAIQFNIAKKLNKTFHQVTPLDVREHGLLVKHKGEMGAQDPPMNYVWDERHEEPFEEGPMAHSTRGEGGEGPYQAEPGDYYSTEPSERIRISPRASPNEVSLQTGYVAWTSRKLEHPPRGMARSLCGSGGLWSLALLDAGDPRVLAEPARGLRPLPRYVSEALGVDHAARPPSVGLGDRSWNQLRRDSPRGTKLADASPRPCLPLSEARAMLTTGASTPISGTCLQAPTSKTTSVGPSSSRSIRRKLDPQHVNPDEDFMLSGGGKLNNQEEHPEYESLGEMADRFGWGDVPSDTERVLNQGKSIGYRGVIPPEALTPGKYVNGEWTPLERTSSWHFGSTMYHVAPAHAERMIAREGLRGDPETWDDMVWLHENEDKARAYAGPDEHVYAVDVTGMEGDPNHMLEPGMQHSWVAKGPIPPERIKRIAATSLIGEMRDGWGRFATAVPWQWGQWGKGIYYPETGTLQTWGDDRTHPEVALEDENIKQGAGHHFIIRPNGTVKDQGAMNTNFEDVEGDVPGLAQALRELDPRLRLDTSVWDFDGPTEPMEEEPSSVSRGEEGGHIQDVQTSSDFAGSL